MNVENGQVQVPVGALLLTMFVIGGFLFLVSSVSYTSGQVAEREAMRLYGSCLKPEAP